MFVCAYIRAVPNIRIRTGPNSGPNGLFVFGRILARFRTRIRIVDNCPRGHAAPRARDETAINVGQRHEASSELVNGRKYSLVVESYILAIIIWESMPWCNRRGP